MSIRGIENIDLLNINLLPEDFLRERNSRRNIRKQRRTAALFLIIVGLCSWQHYERGSRLLLERDQTVNSVGQITGQLQNPVASRAELEALEARAARITFLRVRGLPTQVFRMFNETLPEEIVLAKLKLSQTTAAHPASAPGTNSPPPLTVNAPTPPGIHRDLIGLQNRVRDRRQEIRIEGEAPDDLVVARFLGKLRRYPLSDDVKLEFTNKLEGDNSESRRRFAIVVRFKSPLQLFRGKPPDTRDVAGSNAPRISLQAPLPTANFSSRGEIR